MVNFTDVILAMALSGKKAHQDMLQYLTTGIIPMGGWDAGTNTPSLTQGSGTVGQYYDVIGAGNWDDTDFLVGDRIIFSKKNIWERIPTGTETTDLPMVIGFIDQTTPNLPTARPDGKELVLGDELKVKNTAILPFTIDGIEIESINDELVWNGEEWQLQSAGAGSTNKVVVNNKTLESRSGLAQYQTDINKELVKIIGKETLDVEDKDTIIKALNFIWDICEKLGYTFDIIKTDTDNGKVRQLQFIVKDYKNRELCNETFKDFVLTGRRVADIDLKDDITPEEMENALKEIEVEYKNKTIDAYKNTFKNITFKDFDEDYVITSTEGFSATPSDDNAVTEKLVYEELAKKNGFVFKGYITETKTKITGAKKGEFWVQAKEMPESNIKVYEYSGTAWGTTLKAYTPAKFDMWANLEDEKLYYYYNNQWYSFMDGEVEIPYTNLEKLNNYLYKAEYDSLQKYIPDKYDKPLGSCTSYIKDGKLYRNYDYYYDDTIEFWVDAYNFKTLTYFKGMSYISRLYQGLMTNELLGQMPYHLVDGTNDAGIMMSTHLVYNDMGYVSKADGIPATKLVYEVVSQYRDIESIVEDLNNSNLKIPTSFDDYIPIYLISDGTKTYCYAPLADGSKYQCIDITTQPKLTNFVPYTLQDEDVKLTDTWLQNRPNGIYRYNHTTDGLERNKYTDIYTNTDKYDDFIGVDNTTKSSPEATLKEIQSRYKTYFEDRYRGDGTWQTLHSIVYGDGEVKHLWIQEDYTKDYIMQETTSSTQGVSVVNAEEESVSGDVLTQYDVNKEFAEIHKKCRIYHCFGKLFKNKWKSDNTQIIEIEEVKEDWIVQMDCDASDIRLIKVEDGKLTFSCTEKPTDDMDVRLLMFISEELEQIIPDESGFRVGFGASGGTIDITPLSTVKTPIDWGDGTVDNNKTHTYADDKIYEITLGEGSNVTTIGDNFMKDNTDLVYLQMDSFHLTKIGSYFCSKCTNLREFIATLNNTDMGRVDTYFMDKCDLRTQNIDVYTTQNVSGTTRPITGAASQFLENSRVNNVKFVAPNMTFMWYTAFVHIICNNLYIDMPKLTWIGRIDMGDTYSFLTTEKWGTLYLNMPKLTKVISLIGNNGGTVIEEFEVHLDALSQITNFLYAMNFPYDYTLNLNTIAPNLTKASGYMCYGLSGLKVIDMRNLTKLTSLGAQSLTYCIDMEEIYVPLRTPPAISDDIFNNCPKLTKIHCGAYLNQYKTAEVWSNFADKMVE